MSKFVIDKGLSNEFVLTIKQTGSTLPMVIETGDTFTAYLVKLEDDAVVATITPTIEDGANGKIKLVFPANIVDTLSTEKGDRCDYYYAKPLYSLEIDCDTTNNGKFVAKVNKVYVS